MRIPLSHIRERAAQRPQGYYEEVVSKGVIDGDVLEIPDEEAAQLYRKYRGIGDIVAAFAKPVAQLVGLENCGGCKDRQEALNKAFPLS